MSSGRTGRTKGGSLVAVLAALLIAVGLTAAPAEATTARAISVAASPNAALAGSAVKFSGRVTRSPKGSLVRVQRKAGSSWVTVVSTRTTTTTGVYAVRAALPKTAAVYSYRAVAPATRTLRTASTRAIAVTALRRTTVTLAASPAGSINPGASKLLVGKASPFVPGTTGYVQRLVGSTWSLVTTVIIGTNGSLSRAVAPAATTSYRVVVARAGLNASAISPTVVVTVNVPPKVTTTTLPPASQNIAYSTTLTKTGKPGSWSLVSGSLPTGITLSTSTGVIAGSTATTGTFPVTVKFTETSTGLSATKGLTLVVSAGPVITTSSPLPDAIRNAQYSTTITKAGGGAGRWTMTGQPSGLSIGATDGTIAGVATALTGSFQVTVTFSETGTARQATKVFSLTVTGENPVITTDALPDATRATSYTAPLAKTGGPGTWTSTALPTGLSLKADTGVISGVASADTGAYPVTITFTEAGSGIQVTKQLDLHVVGQDLAITTTSLPDGTRGTSYAATLTKTGGAGTWSSTALPSGLSLNTSTGAIGGTPVGHPGTVPVTVTFTESATGRKATKALSLKIDGEDISVTSTSLVDGTTQTAYNAQLTKTGLDGTWSWAPAGTTATAPTSTTSLPGGLSVSQTGVISGSPSGAGDWNIRVTFTETTSGLTASRVLYLHVSPKNGPEITTVSLPNGIVGAAYSADLDSSPQGTWSKVDGTLPPGLSLNGGNGNVTGTPTQAGDYVVIVKTTVLLGLGGTNTKRFTIHVDAAP